VTARRRGAAALLGHGQALRIGLDLFIHKLAHAKAGSISAGRG